MWVEDLGTWHMDPTCHSFLSFLRFHLQRIACVPWPPPLHPCLCAAPLSFAPLPLHHAVRLSLLIPFVMLLNAAREPWRFVMSSHHCRKRALEVCPMLAMELWPLDIYTPRGPPCSPAVLVLLELIHGGPPELHPWEQHTELHPGPRPELHA